MEIFTDVQLDPLGQTVSVKMFAVCVERVYNAITKKIGMRRN